MEKTVKINDTPYTIEDQLENLSIVDSFSKLKMGSGHGEARLYIGQDESVGNFWNDGIKSFFLKQDLNTYIENAELEYKNPSQPYIDNVREKWDKNRMLINDLENNIQFFDASKSNAKPPRIYINSNNDIYNKVFRQIALPVITHMTIFKLKDKNGNKLYYFKPYLDNSYDHLHHNTIVQKEIQNINTNSSMAPATKMQLINARVGQGVFRTNLIKEWSSCMMTGIDELRIVVASHIKPWIKSDDDEKISRYNGLLLAATYDRLFDQGLISFKSDGALMISNHISDYNAERLNLVCDTCYDIPHLEERESFLKYHRNNVFMN